MFTLCCVVLLLIYLSSMVKCLEYKMKKIMLGKNGHCPTCGQNKIIMDAKIGELYCTYCGFVISENSVDIDGEWRSSSGNTRNTARVGDPLSIVVHDMGLSTIIGKKNQDVKGKPISNMMKNSFNRLRRQSSQVQFRSSNDKNLAQAFREMNNLKMKLALPDIVIKTAAYRYRKAVEKGLIKGRTIKAMVGACVYLACRDVEISRSLSDVAKTIDVSRKDLSKCYRVLLVEFEISVPPPNPFISLSKIANILGLSEKAKRKAIELLEREKDEGGFEGRDPNGLAAAVLYVAGRKCDEIKSQKQVSLAAGVTQVTVRNRIQGLTESSLLEYRKMMQMRKTNYI